MKFPLNIWGVEKGHTVEGADGLKGALWAMLFAIAFAVVGAAVFAANEAYVVMLLPLAFVALWLMLHHIDLTLMLIAFSTPFALNMEVLPQTQLSMPVEPLLILFSVVFLFRVLLERNYDRRLLRHPVSVIVLCMLGWMFITSATSALPLVSFKYTLARSWFLIPCFFASALLFKNPQRIRQVVLAYAVGLAVVVLITTIKTVTNYSDLQTLHRIMRPFYNDHTAYGAAIAIMLPAVIHLLFSTVRRRWRILLLLVLVAILFVGLFFSYCRAAWLGMVGALAIYVMVRMGVRVKWMITLFLLAAGGLLLFQGDLIMQLGKNHQDSSYELADQLKSISNVSTDASNLERLNRWACVFRMWSERPLTGYGPGTYQFLYGSYQKSYQLSTISTNAGNLGNAHSEYLGPLADQGLIGSIIVIALFLTTFSTGVKVFRQAKDRRRGRLALALALGLLTYYVHGLFNNFLDTDKLSVPFWCMTAAIVSLDVFSEKVEKA